MPRAGDEAGRRHAFKGERRTQNGETEGASRRLQPKPHADPRRQVGCSRILVSLSTRHNLLFKSHAAIFMKAVEKAVRDRNDTVSSSYATAAGYLTRLVPDRHVVQAADFCRALYFDGEGFDPDSARRAL